MPKELSRPSPGEMTTRVYSRVRDEIARGLIAPGHCVPSERELGRLLKVSRVTVRRGLDQLVKEGLLRREPSRGYFLPVAADHAKPSPDGRRSVILIHDHTEAELASGTYHARMWAGAREEANRLGYLTMIASMPSSSITPAAARDISLMAAGVLCDHPNPDTIRCLLNAGIPSVQVDYYRDEMSVDTVVQDDMGGIAAAVQHLFDHGHRRIGYIDATLSLRVSHLSANAERRRAGFLMACERLGLPADSIAPGDHATGAAATGVDTLLRSGVTALVLPHSELWPSARDTLSAAGIPIPGPFGIVVWGDAPATGASNLFPSSLEWSKEQMGREAVRRLLTRLERPGLEPATILIPTRLIDRRTAGRGTEQKKTGDWK